METKKEGKKAKQIKKSAPCTLCDILKDRNCHYKTSSYLRPHCKGFYDKNYKKRLLAIGE